MRVLWVLALVASVGACVDRTQSPITPAAFDIGSNQTVFVATSRKETTDGHFGFERSEQLSLLEYTISIPPSHTLGDLKFGYRKPDPQTEFVIAGLQKFESPKAFQARISDALIKLPLKFREVTVFVHGFNTTQAETAFRAAQLAHDLKQPGLTIIYSWPSQGKALGYVYDNDSMLFARDGLEQLIRGLNATGLRHVNVVAHSLGGALLMETLRQIDIQNPGLAAELVDAVILISPDLDIEVFRRQMSRLKKVPDPFVIFVSKKDKVLNVSSFLRGRGRIRLGNIDNIKKISDLPVKIVDTTAFASDAGSTHFIPATSPALIALLNKPQAINNTFYSEDLSLDNFVRGDTVAAGGGRAKHVVLTPRIDGTK
ncbi:MAG: alpha/beta fold hydrolase [Rhodobacteraceae bacterium]|nr:alpha/beta fold hydrolase [Paracoccaceae bacterium]